MGDETDGPVGQMPIPRKCERKYFQKHTWGPWESIREGKIMHGGNVTGYYIEQKSVCLDCGKVRIRSEES